MSAWAIRPERHGEESQIGDVVQRAFAPMPFSDGTEANLVDGLRNDGDLLLSLVAEQGGSLIGHIGFSPITIDGGDLNWVQLSPLSVTPEWQHKGIGTALIKAGIAEMRARRVHGIGVEGNPAYYERFGFIRQEGLEPAGPHAKYFRSMAFNKLAPRGEVRYAAAFY